MDIEEVLVANIVCLRRLESMPCSIWLQICFFSDNCSGTTSKTISAPGTACLISVNVCIRARLAPTSIGLIFCFSAMRVKFFSIV